MAIFAIIAILAFILMIVFWLIIIKNNKDRKEPLTIMKDGDTIRLFLSDDEYCRFDISDIKDDQKKINEKLAKVIKDRSKELVNLVDRVSFFRDRDKTIYRRKIV